MNTIGVTDRRQHLFAFLILGILCLLTFSNSLHNGFMIDDHGLVLENPAVHNSQNLIKNFFPSKGSSEVYYHPVLHFLIAVKYLWFKTDPFGYHAVNLVLFFLAVLALYGFVFFVFENFVLALLTAVLFTVHPINGVLVNYMTATAYSVMIASVFLSLMLASRAYSDEKIKPVPLLLSLVLFVLALLCHEIVVVYPLYLAAVFYFIRNQSPRKVFFVCLPSLLIVVVYFFFRLKYAAVQTSMLDKIPSLGTDVFGFGATFFRLIAWYIQKLFIPQGILLIWTTPIVRTHVWLWDIVFLVVIVAALSLMFFKKSKTLSLGLAFFMTGLIPVTLGCVFQSRWGLMIEPHWLFFSSFGFLLITASFLLALYEQSNKKIVGILIVFLCGCYIVVSFFQNRLWKDEETYCEYWLTELPGYQGAMFHLASSYMRQGRFVESRAMYAQALSGQWDDWEIYTNLGLMDYKEKNFSGAVTNYQKALLYKKDSAVTYTDLGAVFLDEGKTVEAHEALEKALQLNSDLLEPRLDLARIAFNEDKFDQAEILLRENLKIDPDDQNTISFLIETLLKRGEKAGAQKLLTRFMNDSRTPEPLVSLGSLMASKGYFTTAVSFYLKALSIDPHNKSAFLEIGKVYGNQNDFNRAIIYWQEGLKFHPQEQEFKNLILQAEDLLKQAPTN